MKRPNFFIVGAPKCGTTSLFYWLSQHPNIYMPKRKEVHYFNDDGMTRIKTELEYNLLFEEAGEEHLAIGEGSTHYLFSRSAPKNILRYNPDAKFIVCVRNPLQMAPSLHSERIAQGMDGLSDFDLAWRESETRPSTMLKAAGSRSDSDRLNYKAYCRLGEQVQRLLKVVPREKVHIIIFDDLVGNPQQVYLDVLSFLEVPELEVNYEAKNPNKVIRSVRLQTIIAKLVSIKRKMNLPSLGVLRRLTVVNTKIDTRREPLPETFSEMKEYYQDDVSLLSEIVGRDLSVWLK